MNKESYHTVNNFNQRAFRIEQVLAPFFDQKEIDELRLLQYRTGILISGSTALQFFDLVVYPDSDLDLYVELRHCRPLAEFLADVGYQFQPTPRQRSTFDEALAFTLSLNFAGTQNLHDEEEDFQGYVNNGIASVYNFSRGSKRIQVITSHTCSMDVILSFHSSVFFFTIPSRDTVNTQLSPSSLCHEYHHLFSCVCPLSSRYIPGSCFHDECLVLYPRPSSRVGPCKVCWTRVDHDRKALHCDVPPPTIRVLVRWTICWRRRVLDNPALSH